MAPRKQNKAAQAQTNTTHDNTVNAAPEPYGEAAKPVVQSGTDSDEPNIAEKNLPMTAKQIDPNQIVTVRNGFQGRLVYKSKRTGELFVWDAFGDEQDMELSELKNARNSCKKFFINNWFMFDEAWIVDYIGVKQYYKFAVSVDEFDELFEKSADEIAEIIDRMSHGQKMSVAYRARQLIADGGIDSNRVIVTLEKHLGTQLLER